MTLVSADIEGGCIKPGPVVLLLLLLLNFAGATYAQDTLQPRDLDGDPNTVEAYFYAPQNITWLADTNLGKSNTFGLERGAINFPSGREINNDGEMLDDTTPQFIAAMNQSQYLGYSNWRLPVAPSVGDTDCSDIFIDLFTVGTGCTAPEVGELNVMLGNTYGSMEQAPFLNFDTNYRWLGSSAVGRHSYRFGGDGELRACVARCDPALVWPVHDGDIGVPVVQNECIDTDGDGWGWDGTQSCRVAVVETECIDTEPLDDGWGWNGITSCQTEEPAQTGECIDTDGDGWGWDGVASCQIMISECVDTPPFNDGWGWNGVTSCQTEEPAQAGECVDTDGDGWGWDGVQSCLVGSGDLVNMATGTVVSTTSLQWTQQDLTNGALLCVAFAWSEDANEYKPKNPGQITQYDHNADGTGRILTLNADGNNVSDVFSWTVENGIYTGGAPIYAADRIEDTTRGFNVWSDSLNYSHCTGIHSSSEATEPCLYAASDTDSDGYGWEDSTSCTVTAESAPAREIFHAGTGEQINLTNLNWQPDDFKELAIGCTRYNYSGTEYLADKILTYYVHDTEIGQVTTSWVVHPAQMRGLRLIPGESVILLDFDAVKTYTEDRTIVHFRIDQLPATIPVTELSIPLNNIDEGEPGGTFDVFFFAGDSEVSVDEWNVGTLHTSFYNIGDPGELRTDVTEILQQAKDAGDTYLSFKFTGGTGTDRYWLDEDEATLQSSSHAPTSYWLDSGIYNGAAPIEAYSELIWRTDADNGFRSWVNDYSYTECLGTQPSGL